MSNAGFMPHIHCYLDTPSLVWTMFATDLAIGLAYTVISLTLYRLVRKIRLPLTFVVLWFGIFIAACGLTHFMEVYTLWVPSYWFSAGIKIITAVASVWTAGYLLRLQKPIGDLMASTELSEKRRVDLESLTTILQKRLREKDLKLKKIEDSFKAFFDLSGVGTALVRTTDGRFIRVNSKLCDMLGYSQDELLRKTFTEVTFSQDKERDWAEYKKLTSIAQANWEIEKRYVKKDGTLIWVKVNGSPLLAELTDMPASISTIQDITEQKRTQEMLEESEDQFRTLAESMPHLAWIARSDGFIFWYNQPWYTYTGTTLEEMKGWGWRTVHKPGYLPKVMVRWQHSIATGQPFEMEFPLRGKDGRYRWFLTRVTPVRDLQGNLVRWFGTNTDIETQKVSQEKLRDAVNVRDEFLTIASHELTTPLTSLKLQIQRTERNLSKGEDLSIDKVQRALRISDRQTKRLTHLVEALLNVSKIQSDSFKLQFLHVRLNNIVAETVERFEEDLIHAQSKIETDIHDDIIGFWDIGAIEQVFTTIISNSLKYAPGSLIKIMAKTNGPTAQITISDNGPGIPKNLQKNLFNRYERATNAKNITGLGLGLFIVKQIILKHQGAILLESDEGQGVSFTITLPLSPSLQHIEATGDSLQGG